jgi:K(+)-stimulated pyrophosphate-energized sodium pump
LTELGFIVALEVGGFVLSLTMTRAPGTREPGAAVYRIVSAVERALRNFLARARGALAFAALLVATAIFAAYALSGRIGVSFLVVGGIGVGAVLTLAAAQLSASATARAAGTTHASSRLGFNAALAAALRAGGAVGIGTETLSTLGALALFALTYLTEGGSIANATNSPSLANPCLVLTGYAIGAAIAALVVGRAGTHYQSGAEAGRSRASFDSNDANDPRNPALVAGLVGDQLGPVAAGSAALFALSATATAAAFVFARSVGTNVDEELRAAALPLVMRSFGMVGCAAGTLAARADETKGQALALLRGLACAAAIAVFGIAGGSYWLVPENFSFVTTAGVLGLAAATLPCIVSLTLADRRAAPIRSAVAAMRDGASSGFGSSLGFALERAIAPLSALIAFAIVAGALGERGAPAGGALIGLSVFTLSLLCLAPYALTALATGAVAKSARSTAALAKLDAESAWRLQRLDDVGFLASAPARAYLFTAVAVAALPVSAGVFMAAGSLGLGRAWAIVCALLGVLGVLSHASHSLRGAARTADDVALEVERQLSSAGPGSPGGPPETQAPSYRACEELTQKAATDGLLFAAGRAAAPLVVLGIGLGLVYRVGGSRLAAAALSTFVATAAVTALGAALAVDGARTVHGGARRLARLERETASKAAPTPEDVLANILGIAAGPAACSQALLLSTFALAILEILI